MVFPFIHKQGWGIEISSTVKKKEKMQGFEDYLIYYMTSSVSGQDEPNSVL